MWLRHLGAPKGDSVSRLPAEELDGRALSDAFRRHKALVMACVLLVAGLAYGYTRTLSESFTASTSVLVKPTLGNPFSPETGSSGQQVTIAMTTEAAVVDSDGVAQIANKTLDKHWDPGSDTVTASVPPNTQVVRIVYRAPTAESARAGAQTVAQAYLDYRRAETSSSQKIRLETLQKQAKAVRANLDKASAEAAKDNPPVNAVQNVQLYANQLVTLETTISTVQSAGTDPGSLVAPAALPDGPTGLDPRLLVGGGALGGLALGLTLAFWRERADKRLRAESQLVVAGLPMLVSLTGSRSGTGSGGHVQPGGYERLRSAVVASVASPCAIGLSAISTELPCGEVALALGGALSRSGYQVGVILSTGQHDRSGTRFTRTVTVPEIGRSSDVHDLLVGHDSLQVLPIDGDIAEVDEFVASATFTNLVRTLRDSFDYLLVAGPDTSTASGLGAGRATDGMLAVVRDRSTTSDQVGELVVRAEQLDVRMLGLVALPRRSRLALHGGVGSGTGRARRLSVGAPPDTTEDMAKAGASAQQEVGAPDGGQKVSLPR